MKLYYMPAACSLAPHIVAAECGLAVEIVKMEIGPDGKKAGGKDYLTINPKGSVPALELDDGQVLTEAQIVMQYLASLRPELGLAKTQGFEMWRFRELMAYLATELHKPVGNFMNPAIPKEAHESLRATLGVRLDFVSRKLEGSEFLMGSSFTVADAYLFTILNWMPYLEVDLAKWPTLAAYQARLSKRPSIQKALQAEGLIPEAVAG